MTRDEFVIKTAEMILNDWRKTMLACDENKRRFNIPGDVEDISFRAFEKAYEIAQEFYKNC